MQTVMLSFLAIEFRWKEREDLVAGARVQVSGGPVGEEKRRIGDERIERWRSRCRARPPDS
jgi:hypothetical protein